jgi:rod shape-determining protein MreD
MKQISFTTVLVTMLVALVFQLYPWSGSGVIVRPDFFLVVTVYWLLRAPYFCNIGLAWLAGLLVDLSTGSLMGQHSLSFAITAFIGLTYQRRLVLFNQWQMLSYVTFLFVLQRVLILLLKLFAGNQSPDWTYILPIFSSLLLWKIMVFVFGDLTRHK